jgi:hypothetical protein
LFQAEVLRLLLREGMISEEFVGKIKSWRHSGFHGNDAVSDGHRE